MQGLCSASGDTPSPWPRALGRLVLETAKAAPGKGMVVVRSTRVTSGAVSSDIVVDDDEAASMAALDLNPARARVVLKLALLKITVPAEIQQYFYDY